MPHPIRFAPTPDIGSLELTEEIIRRRAYELFELRGWHHGHDVEDWLEAEAEVLGKKTAAGSHENKDRSKVVSAA